MKRRAIQKAAATVIPAARRGSRKSPADPCAHLATALAEARRTMEERGITPGQADGEAFATNKLTAYHDLIARIRETVRTKLPANATVAVVNKGDVELLKLDGRPALHFPRNADGSYSGHYPATASDAVAQLEAVRAEGARYLIFPATSLWWLEFYGDFRAHLEAHYRQIVNEDEVCMIFALQERRSSPGETGKIAGTKTGSSLLPEPEDEISLRIELAKSLKALGRPKRAQQTLAAGLTTKPVSARLHIALMQLALSEGDKAAALEHENSALSLMPNDYSVNMAIAKTAWQQQRHATAEERLTHLVTLLPSDGVALNDLMNLYCSRAEAKRRDANMLKRFISRLANAATRQNITPVTYLRICEALGGANAPEPALASLDAALREFDFSSEKMQGFVARLLRPVITDQSAIPFSDPLSLAAFLTHSGNGFAAVADHFRAGACWRLAAAADGRSWNSSGWAARFNLAFAAMARGDAACAMQFLAGATRLYADETARILWPSADCSPWPHSTMDLSASFEKMKPAGIAWPKITVITPSFNQAAYVEETLLSVLHQSYPALEYIVVDGASSDGSVEILRRYESKLAKLIIEKDDGQTEAINKGLRLATGEIILWVNSDDLLGPGALFMIALAWLEDGADIIAGFCCEHTERRFGLVNLPAATQATFNTECLGDIFHYWLKGHYFYQPEVAFSRRILDKVGGTLDERLYYTMDYEFWLRCAAAGARLSTVCWPIGLFRKHDQQKTANTDRTVIEQAVVRDRFTQPSPVLGRRLEIRRRLQRAFENERPRVAIVSTRASKIFSADTARQIRESLAAEGFDAVFADDCAKAGAANADVVLMLVHIHREHEMLRKLRDSGCDAPVAGWFWDNHHHVFDNYTAGKDLDLCVAGHAFAESYLRSQQHLMAPPVPLCVTQWTDDEATQFFRKHGGGKRSDALYGGFVRYDFAAKRNRLIQSLVDEGSGGIYFLEEDKLAPYFGKSPSDRFAEWASRKVSLCLPLDGDLSQRFFDALLTGQVPVVAPDIFDLDGVIPRDMQEQLPVVRMEDYSVAAVKKAHAEALRLFNRDGQRGVQRRHQFALRNHMFTARIRTLIGTLRTLSR